MRNADCGIGDQKSVASAFIADEISVLKDPENVYYFLLTNSIIMCHFLVRQDGCEDYEI